MISKVQRAVVALVIMATFVALEIALVAMPSAAQGGTTTAATASSTTAKSSTTSAVTRTTKKKTTTTLKSSRSTTTTTSSTTTTLADTTTTTTTSIRPAAGGGTVNSTPTQPNADMPPDPAQNTLRWTIAGLVALAVLVLVGTILYWRATRPPRGPDPRVVGPTAGGGTSGGAAAASPVAPGWGSGGSATPVMGPPILPVDGG